MYLARIDGRPVDATASLTDVQSALGTIAGGLDARFVEAGTTLASGYEIVEKLVRALEGVTNALEQEAADTAIAKLRTTAHRLLHLPDVQAERARALGTIQKTSRSLHDQIAQVKRMLAFLRICGLNIKVAAAGRRDFSEFADMIFVKLDLGETEIGSIAHDIEQLVKSIPAVQESELRLAAECARIVPHVPMKLADDALTLQQHQSEAANRAVHIADVARDVRTRVATALGALQIGDITRQRLEHVADGIKALEAFIEERSDLSPEAAETIRGHVLAMLAAQAQDAAADLERESSSLLENVRAIGPGAKSLLKLKDEGSDDHGETALHVVERSVAEVAVVTGQLQDADARSNRLSSAASETVANLARRLGQIRKLTNDVQQMAWNTDLRCNRMGMEGRALATVASEIRGFASRLETISTTIAALFDQLIESAGSIGDPGGSEGNSGQALVDSLASIRSGGERLRRSLIDLESDASAVAELLDGTTEKVDCEDVSAALSAIVEQLAPHARSNPEPAEEAIQPLRELLGSLARSYTMASERAVHARFALPGDAAVEEAVEEAGFDDDDFDDGLF